MINKIKRVSTFLVLSGILLTNLNFYPANIFFHRLGALGWIIVSYIKSDKAIMTNFGLQIPIFLLGFIKLVI
tara:strand:+ start:958 stop:1173 length:216 start_codon:yes stop_codon:yes gene_type:complete